MNTKNIQIKDTIVQAKDYFTLQFRHENTFKLLRTSLFCFLLIDTLLALPVAAELWGPNAYIVQTDAGFTGIWSVLNLVSLFGTLKFLYIAFVLGKIFFLILGILNIAPLFSTIFTYICLLNLDNKAWVVMNGGNNIVHVVFIYLILMHLGRSEKNNLNSAKQSGFFSQFGNVLANFAFFSARLQIVIVYFVAGLTKLQSHLWRDGVALYYVLQTREFTHPWAQKIFLSSDLLITLGTYGTLLFQLSFPWLVWNQHTKKYVLFIGTIIHLQIAFVMGLFDFGITVSIMYLVFLNEVEARTLMDKFKRPFLSSNHG